MVKIAKRNPQDHADPSLRMNVPLMLTLDQTILSHGSQTPN
jgi:hypothetical protein